MWDAWMSDYNIHHIVFGAADNATARFNHVPSGSNILFMDGHVTFEKSQAAYPLGDAKGTPGDLGTQLVIWGNLMGGWG
jgi:prepilin-type processing-associated H-X9-DG protein